MCSLAYQTVQKILRNWPFTRGHHRVERFLLDRVMGGLPSRGDIDFEFGRFIDVSLAPWPHGFRELWAYGYLEQWETLAWLSLLDEGDLVVDGGANYGYWSLVASRAVQPSGMVIAVEAVPQTAVALRRNLYASNASNVSIVEAALSDSNGTAKFHLFAEDPFAGRSSIGLPIGEREISSVDVPTRRLDDILQEYGRSPRLIKLDIEGSELLALNGGSDTIASPDAPIITFEWNAATARSVGWHPRDALAKLALLGYRYFRAGPSGLTAFLENAIPEDWTPMIWAFKSSKDIERVNTALKTAAKRSRPALLMPGH